MNLVTFSSSLILYYYFFFLGLVGFGCCLQCAQPESSQITATELEAAAQFLCVFQKYLASLLDTIPAHSIGDVTTSGEKISVLLKDSYLESFPRSDRAFMRQFTDTQMFTVYVDTVLARK